MSIDISFKLELKLGYELGFVQKIRLIFKYFELIQSKFWDKSGLFHFDPLNLYYECQIDNEEMMREKSSNLEI